VMLSTTVKATVPVPANMRFLNFICSPSGNDNG
jgi:hypothetical protein